MSKKVKISKFDIKCEGTLHCEFIEPAIGYFFGDVNPTKKEVLVEFIVHNGSPSYVDIPYQYLTLTKVNGADLHYKVPYTSQGGNVDMWESIAKKDLKLNIIIGIDSFYITNITKL